MAKMEVNEVNILKVAIAALMDDAFGSTKGWTNEREVKMVKNRLGVSTVLAKKMLEAADEVREAKAFDLI